MKKSKVRALLIKEQEEIVKDLRESVEGLHEDADLDEEATREMDDFAHQEESGDMERRLKEQLQKAEFDLSSIKKLTETVCDEVKIGALVETNKNVFYISVPVPPVKVDGTKVIGISTKAPIFAKMKGLKKGDTFSMANIDYEIIRIS